jgi:hypothetical protein
MGIMNDEKRLDAVLERFYQRFNRYNTKVLKTLGEAIKQFDGLTPSQAHKLAQELKYSTEIDQLLNELSQLSGKSVQELDILLDKVAEENVAFAETYYKVKGKDFIPYEDNIQLKRYVETIKKDTKGTFKQLSHSKQIGFTFKEGDKIIYKPLKKVFNDLLDEAAYNVSTGVTDYQSAMRNTIKQLADSGVKIHEDKVGYPSGYNRRIDSSVRQNILTSVKQINIGIQERVGEELGADGVEISAHSPCAEDHIYIQGQQFSKKEFKKIDADLERPIGTLNCRHFVFSIILGVNKPSYTNKQLKGLRDDSLREVEYEGKKYTAYECTQIQRRLETSIRQQKDRQIIARASGNKEEISNAQRKISQLTYKYNDFSNKANLDTYKNRLNVSGYRRVSTK